MLNLARPNTKDPGRQESGRLSLGKGGGQGEGDSGDRTRVHEQEFKSKTARALPPGRGRDARFAN